ncbi:hypothetical protein EB1_35580 [Empedobacter brevis NBRC 14943 = ATCC 43319]|uniref:Lipoprotein n=3 Tax=Empedobacter brevis TaxID=247 RepID=A0A511NMT3_9FLAO|nr:hypothetical protein EB1_35580 [Empedobacter brevis NBRC 14943 = ATCC 43319]
MFFRTKNNSYKMKKIILISCLLLVSSCLSKKSNDNEKVEIIVGDSSTYLYDTIELQRNIIEKGDIYSYNRLEDVYEQPEDSLTYRLLKYSYIMADKYAYNYANRKIIRDLVRKELKTNNLSLIGDLDSKNKTEVFARLNQCAQQNEISCLTILRDYYKKNNNKSEAEKIEKLLDSIMYKK